MLMRNFLIALCFVIFLEGCTEKHRPANSAKEQTKLVKDSLKNKYTSKQQTKVAYDSANDNTEPSFEEVLAYLRAAYNKVEHIDKTVIDGGDTLQLHETYYCLHDSSLVVPKFYVWGGDTTKNFTANTFATKIIVINNRDTVLNKVFKRMDFNSALWDRLRLYAVIMFPYYDGYNASEHKFALGYSITIPLTDVGVPASIAIDKKGKYQILDEYVKMDGFKKD